MRVLIAGAGGFLGGATTAAFVGAADEVVGLVRTPEAMERVRRAGGVPVLGDVTLSKSVETAATGCDVIVHLAATDAPGLTGPEAERVSERVRVLGARHLIAAALAVGVRRVVIGSGYWVYADTAGVITEESPVAPRGLSRFNFAAEEVGRTLSQEGGLEVMVARPGMVYGPGSWFREMLAEIRAGRYRYPDAGQNYWSFVALEDAASAFRAIAERGVPGGIYNVVDGRPERLADFTRFVAAVDRSPPPSGIPRSTLRQEVGDETADHLAANRYAGNARLRALSWTPSVPSVREGIPPLLRRMARRPSPD